MSENGSSTGFTKVVASYRLEPVGLNFLPEADTVEIEFMKEEENQSTEVMFESVQLVFDYVEEFGSGYLQT